MDRGAGRLRRRLLQDLAGDVYDRPEEPAPIFVAASGPLAAKLAGRAGDGFISTSGKDPDLYRDLIEKVAEGAKEAGRDPAQVRADRAHTRFIVSDDPDDPDEVVERVQPYVDAGFQDLVLHAPGEDQVRFLDQFAADVLPRLRERYGAVDE